MIDVAFLGTEVRPAQTAVVIDVLRATSTITLALASGYERVLIAGSIEEAQKLRAPGRVLAGEVRCARAPGFDLGNSPEETLSPRGSELVLATTNGAPAIIRSAAVADEVLAASMLNFGAVVELLARADDVLLVAAGTDGEVTIEDVYLAGRISAALEGERSDAALVAEAVAAAYRCPLDALEASRGAIGLRREGLESDIVFCAQESIVDTVPRLAATDDAIPVMTAGQVVADTPSEIGARRNA
ncbi:MAG: 2-phosphosulfolactate phosphatase [Solirubrobacteraceae bacterium]|jgi:2-phosphosulfolactate phosphatase|nr:2-phosphosulfolactate phosphatase [Solirubrobacteraceae bacterium]